MLEANMSLFLPAAMFLLMSTWDQGAEVESSSNVSSTVF